MMLINYKNNSLKWAGIISLLLASLYGCSGSDNPPPVVPEGLHITAAIYDAGDPVNIDDNVVTIYFSEAIDQATLPITPLLDSAFVVTGSGAIYARSSNYSIINDFVYKLEITLDSIAIEPEPGVTQIALAPSVIADLSGITAEDTNTAALFSAPQVILKTGQTLSYDNDGNPVLDDSIRDDGYHQKGEVRNFTRDALNGIVTNNSSNQIWQDNAPLPTLNWTDAVNQCELLDLAGHQDWHLASIKQLASIVDFSLDIIGGNGIDPVFQQHSENSWASEINAGDPSRAWSMSFIDSLFARPGLASSGDITLNVEARCTTTHFILAEYIRHPVHNIVFDTSTKLMWQDEGLNTADNWETAVSLCNGLSLGGYTDWRLPNINELQSIVDYNKYNPAMSDNSFIAGSPSDFYWSSTTDAHNLDFGWSINFESGYSIVTFKKSPPYILGVRCVRDSQ